MSQENVEIVRAVYEEFARGDFSAFTELPDEFVFVASPELPDAGTLEILQRGRPRGSQTEVEGRWWVVMTMRGGDFARTEIYPERAQALEVAGLSE